jgi:hypothetical protein
VQKRGVHGNNALSLLGLAAILFAIFVYDENTPFPSVYSLVPVIGVVLLILFADKETLVSRLLGTKLFVVIGLISYSTYLWHQPLLAFGRLQAKTINLPTYLAVAIIFLSIFLAYLSWRYIETPFRNRNFLTAKTILALSIVSLIVLGGIGFLTKNATHNHEYLLAEKLSTSNYVYFANLDERKFNEGRLVYPLRSVEALVMGSSRAMQIDSKVLGINALNLSVSGASVEDYIAFVGEAVSKLRPLKVLLGADPWLFNLLNSAYRWRSSEELYNYWQGKITKGLIGEALDSKQYLPKNQNDELFSPLQKFYKFLNGGGVLVAEDGDVEATAKKAYDGLHIYSEVMHSSVYEPNFNNHSYYSMSEYEHDTKAKLAYIQLIKWLQLNGIEVSLILSPYHPKLYEKMVSEKPIFISIEEEFRNLAKDLNLNVLGSYNPHLVGCDTSYFYDHMHPKGTCMSKLFNGWSEK